MPQRRKFVAKLPTDDGPLKKPLPRIPADLEKIVRPRSGQRWYQDTTVTPLRLRVSRRGLAWVFHGRTADGPRRISLGAYPNVSLDEARGAATRKTAETKPASAPLTFAQLRIGYFASTQFQGLAPRTQKSYRWTLEGDDYKGFAGRKVRDISRRDLLDLGDRIAKDGRAYQNILRPAQALFSWALDREYVDVSPAVRLKLPANEADPNPYTDVQLGDVVIAAREATEPYRTLYLLTAYTGQRPSTWANAKWREVNLRSGVLTVSRARGRQSKLKKGWAIPLAKPVVALLQALQKSQGRRQNEWLFGRALGVESKVRNKIAKAAGMAGKANRGTMHRFRATFLTKLTEWRVPTETQQRLAGHASAFEGSRKHYIPAPPSPEMRAVADRYAEHIPLCELL